VSGKIEPREYLGASGRRHVWVAERMGITKSYLSHLLAGRRSWTPALQHRFANAIGMDASAFNFAQNLPANESRRNAEGSGPAEALDSAPERDDAPSEYSDTPARRNGSQSAKTEVAQ
jgi:transcriptional regulator with XRE-family HTH domain